jgi:hypothetical protein
LKTRTPQLVGVLVEPLKKMGYEFIMLLAAGHTWQKGRRTKNVVLFVA